MQARTRLDILGVDPIVSDTPGAEGATSPDAQVTDPDLGESSKQPVAAKWDLLCRDHRRYRDVSR